MDSFNLRGILTHYPKLILRYYFAQQSQLWPGADSLSWSLIQSGLWGHVPPWLSDVAHNMANKRSLCKTAVRKHHCAVHVGVGNSKLGQSLVLGIVDWRVFKVHILWVQAVSCWSAEKMLGSTHTVLVFIHYWIIYYILTDWCWCCWSLLYIALFSTLEQTHCTRVWFYRSD